jgi:PAS domain-containing protein
VDHFVGLLQDITERQRTEERIQESERRFHLLIESIPHFVWSRRSDGTPGYWNVGRSAKPFFGLTADLSRCGRELAVGIRTRTRLTPRFPESTPNVLGPAAVHIPSDHSVKSESV